MAARCRDAGRSRSRAPADRVSAPVGRRAARHFTIHMLGTELEAIAMNFARSGQAFDGLDVRHSANGVPLLRQCIARFECDTDQIHDADDHAIILGQ